MKDTCSAIGRPLLVASLLLAVLGGCSTPEKVTPPAQLLHREKMVSLLVQLHLLEAQIEASRLSTDSARALFQSKKKELLWKNNVSETDSLLQHSYRYYALHDKDMNEIYKEVIDSLQARQTQLNGGKPAEGAHPW
ncbi:MAG TPA: DUF4296 domain-containing protein [Hymenobacter sp.]|uniref:DUF4296 domain-containing protein n=1 Tax=Hymenobacter sp. TaxID=1898978 RepID=UPI002D80A210|nr:DUF4296 domain-containing protein [Hymenobacter sp.]HET9504707.1 DUF4296 domain-containing protein [Hymenobacter sp.]